MSKWTSAHNIHKRIHLFQEEEEKTHDSLRSMPIEVNLRNDATRNFFFILFHVSLQRIIFVWHFWVFSFFFLFFFGWKSSKIFSISCTMLVWCRLCVVSARTSWAKHMHRYYVWANVIILYVLLLILMCSSNKTFIISIVFV